MAKRQFTLELPAYARLDSRERLKRAATTTDNAVRVSGIIKLALILNDLLDED